MDNAMDTLSQMLEDYCNDERGLPSYEELCGIVAAEEVLPAKSIGGVARFRTLLYLYSIAFADDSIEDKEYSESNSRLSKLIEFIDEHFKEPSC